MIKTKWENLLWSEKMARVGTVVSFTGLGMVILDDFLSRRIPYTYRSTVADTIDYIFGKNVFHRKDSLQ